MLLKHPKEASSGRFCRYAMKSIQRCSCNADERKNKVQYFQYGAAGIATRKVRIYMSTENNIIQIENLKFAYENGPKILKGINLTIQKGKLIGLIGDSGCGKSTLCHMMCGIIPNVIGGSASGQIRVKDKNMRETELKDMAQTVGFVMQDSDRMIVSSTVEDELAFGPENLCIPPEEIRSRVDSTLELLHMTEFKETDPNHLSGGQKQLVTIGAVLTLQPDILILDEPFSHLDEGARIRTMELLMQLKSEGKTIIIVEHDHQLIEEADEWILLENGLVRIQGTPEAVKEKLLDRFACTNRGRI